MDSKSEKKLLKKMGLIDKINRFCCFDEDIDLVKEIKRYQIIRGIVVTGLLTTCIIGISYYIKQSEKNKEIKKDISYLENNKEVYKREISISQINFQDKS